MQHATGRVERPGESQEALDGKKTERTVSELMPFLFCGLIWTHKGWISRFRMRIWLCATIIFHHREVQTEVHWKWFQVEVIQTSLYFMWWWGSCRDSWFNSSAFPTFNKECWVYFHSHGLERGRVVQGFIRADGKRWCVLQLEHQGYLTFGMGFKFGTRCFDAVWQWDWRYWTQNSEWQWNCATSWRVAKVERSEFAGTFTTQTCLARVQQCEEETWVAFGASRAVSTREALLSEAGFEKVFRTQNWVRRSKQFCRWSSGVHIGCCLNPLEVSFLLFRCVWWLDCLLLKEGASAFCSLRWLLEVFLAVEEFVGFRAGGRLPFDWLYWILYCPLSAPLPL